MNVETSATRRALLVLTAGNLLIALANTAPLLFGKGLSSALQTAFAFVAMVGWLGLFLFVFGGAMSLAAGTGRGRLAVRWIAPALFTLVQAVLFLDVRIYGMFRFHFNGVVWHTLTTPGGWDSLHIPTADIVALGLGVLALAVTQGWVLRRLEERGGAERRVGSPPGGRTADQGRIERRANVLPFMTWKRAFIAIAVFSAADRVTFAAFDLMRDYEIARAARVVPGYQRFTIRTFAKTWFGWEPGRADLALSGRTSASGLNYPSKPLTWKAPEKKINILWVALESWRHDAFDAEHAPEIWEISKKSQVFDQHLSGGNNTTFGVFSMFYGLYGSYRSAFLSEHRGPALIDRMLELDYRFAIYSSFPMTWPEFRKYAFIDVVDSVKDQWPEAESAKNDPLIIDELLSFIDDPSKKDQPFFGFLLLDSSHAPYTFPPEYGKYTPFTQDAKFVRYIDVTQRAPEMRNRYFNAVLWESYQVGRLWKELEARGLLESTAIVITGDHGEEFNEHGFWTHSGGYTPEQINVPMILWWPGAEPRRVPVRTSHMDLAPTFMEALGVENPPADYCQGQSLLDHTGDEFVVSCGWRDCGVADDEGYVVFGLESHYSMNFDVLDKDYKAVADPRAAMAARSDSMITVMQQMSAFLK